MLGAALASDVLIADSICRSTSVAKSRSPFAISAPMCDRPAASSSSTGPTATAGTGEGTAPISRRYGRLAPSPLRVENLGVVGLTPVRLGACEPVRQRGAGDCGTVDCCHEREGQTHSWEAPTDGTSCPADQGATPPHLTTEPSCSFAAAVLRARHRRSKPGDSQASLIPERQPQARRRDPRRVALRAPSPHKPFRQPPGQFARRRPLALKPMAQQIQLPQPVADRIGE